MRTLSFIAGAAMLLWLGACATVDESPVEPDPEPAGTPAVETVRDILETADIAAFSAADGTLFRTETIVTLATGGPPQGRLVPTSSRDDITLYVTRDGSVPSASNNWGGPIDPRNPRPVSRPLEGVASYRIVAELEGAYSEPFTITVIWRHEESPDVGPPAFSVGGQLVSGSISVAVSDGSDPQARLAISCRYTSAMLYLTRDGSDPSVDNYWRAQPCEGTYIWSPEPTGAEYRVIALWHGVRSPISTITVDWVD